MSTRISALRSLSTSAVSAIRCSTLSLGDSSRPLTSAEVSGSPARVEAPAPRSNATGPEARGLIVFTAASSPTHTRLGLKMPRPVLFTSHLSWRFTVPAWNVHCDEAITPHRPDQRAGGTPWRRCQESLRSRRVHRTQERANLRPARGRRPTWRPRRGRPRPRFQGSPRQQEDARSAERQARREARREEARGDYPGYMPEK